MGSHIVAKSAGDTNWVLLEEVLDRGGVLTGLAVAGGRNDHYFRVTIDGRELVSEFLCGARGGRENNGIGVNLPFDSSLRVEIRDEPRPDPLACFWAAYTVSGSRLVGRTPLPPEKDSAGEISYAYEQIEYETSKGERYKVKSLMGPERISRVILKQDCILGAEKEPIRGRLELRSLKWTSGDKPPYEEPCFVPAVRLILRPVGRTREFEIWTKDVNGEATFEYPFFAPGTFDIVAQKPGYVNIPATLSIL